jgi:uncharacterized membrane protein
MTALAVNPFDPRSVLLAKHAQHVVLIHFPVALCFTGVGLDVAAHWKRRAAFATAAYINLTLAAIFVVPTLASGLAAWQWALEGQKLKGILLMHLIGGLLSAGFIWTSWAMHFFARRRAASQPANASLATPDAGMNLSKSRLAVELLGVACVGITAHLGGFLSGVNM